MPNFSGGGGLPKIAAVTVAGGAVTTLTTGAITPVNNRWHDIHLVTVGAGASISASLFVNGDTTSTNYSRTRIDSSSLTSAETAFEANWTIGTGYAAVGFGKIMCDGTNVHIQVDVRRTGGSTTGRYRKSFVSFAASSITELQLTSDAASGLAGGTNLIITEAY